MAGIVKIKVGNEEVDAIEQQFNIQREEWNEYKLFDGGLVRLKTSIQRIFRVVDSDGNPTHNAQGDPNIVVRHRSDIVAAE